MHRQWHHHTAVSGGACMAALACTFHRSATWMVHDGAAMYASQTCATHFQHSQQSWLICTYVHVSHGHALANAPAVNNATRALSLLLTRIPSIKHPAPSTPPNLPPPPAGCSRRRADCAGELRPARLHDDRHGLAHAQRRRPGHVRRGRGRRRRRGRHGWPAVGAQGAKGHRCQAGGKDEQVDLAKGRHPQGGPAGHMGTGGLGCGLGRVGAQGGLCQAARRRQPSETRVPAWRGGLLLLLQLELQGCL